MGTFTLDTSTLGGEGDAIKTQVIEGLARWAQFKVTHAEKKAFTFLGLWIYVDSAGEVNQ